MLQSLADLPSDRTRDEGAEFYPPYARSVLDGTGEVLSYLDANRFDARPVTLASIPISPDFASDSVDHFPPFLGDFGRGRDFSGVRTAFLQGINAVGDAAQSGPSIGFTVGNEIKPIKPGRPIERHQFDAEREHHRMWPPLQLDLPRLFPPKGVPQRVTDLVNRPGLEDQMMEAIGAGRTMIGDAVWYDTDPLRRMFVEKLGHNAGTVDFYDFMKFIAAASPGSDVGTSIRNASRNFNIFRRGEPMPKAGDDIPAPYGNRWASLLQWLAKAVAEGKEFDSNRYAKIASFVENLFGNTEPVTVDIHALRLPAILARDANFLKREYREKLERGEISMDDAVANPSYWRNPYPNEYPTIEQFYKKLAARAKLTPAEAQAAAWLGGGHMTGLKSGKLRTFMEHFNDRIRRTAEKWGISEEEVLDRFIKGQMDRRNAAA